MRSSSDRMVVIRNKQPLPQCCSLMLIDKMLIDILNSNLCISDQKGRLLLSNKIIEQTLDVTRKIFPQNRYEQNGPAVTADKTTDYVCAFLCSSLHDDFLTWMTRPRPGYWLKQETVTKAQHCEMFLVYPGRIGHVFHF